MVAYGVVGGENATVCCAMLSYDGYGVLWGPMGGVGLSGGPIGFYAWGDGNLWSRTGPHVEGMGFQEILCGLGSHEVYGVL